MGEILIQRIQWGLLGPEEMVTERRTRTLGISAAVRRFNDLAVPGLGGIWFGRQLFLAALGVAVAEGARSRGRQVQNIETANAIEALGCLLALKRNGWQSDPRLRGATKLQGLSELTFARVRKRSTYVTQPMRMATLQPLQALGIVESSTERFNTFAITQRGQDLIEAVCRDFNPCHYSRSVLEHLINWATVDGASISVSEKLADALSPLTPLSEYARDIFRESLFQGSNEADARRRRAGLAWVNALRTYPAQRLSWDFRPEQIDDEHWRDLYAGGLFFAARDASLHLLDQVEVHIAQLSERQLQRDQAIVGLAADSLAALRDKASRFIERQYDPSPGQIATQFCGECTNPDPGRVLESLVLRDGRVLRMRGEFIVPGPAFQGRRDTGQGDDSDQPENDIGLETETFPPDISYRVRNLFRLNQDLHGELDAALKTEVSSQ